MLASPSDIFRLETHKTGATIAVNVEPAFDAAARRRGLLRRERLASGSAMVLAPCAAIHTALMRFPIDVIFAGHDGTILKICPAVKPWRMAAALKAFAVIELAAGGAAAASVGDRLVLVRSS